MSTKAQLREAILEQLSAHGYEPSLPTQQDLSKNFIRHRHNQQRNERLDQELNFIKRRAAPLLRHFAEGTEISPDAIRPQLIEVEQRTEHADLFRLASLLWSIPTSRGYGRRMRFLVVDQQNQRLIGILGLGDPVFNLAARDRWIGWDAQIRRARLVNVLDAYVLGAVPPYSHLISGKLIAALATCKTITRRFRRKYGHSEGIISEAGKEPHLSLITATSALGRSSLYNRLRLPSSVSFQRIGTTKGYGHFHIPGDLVMRLRGYLQRRDHRYAHGNRFGDGPNWKMRLIREGLRALGIGEHALFHGIQREVYAAPLATNCRSHLLGRSARPRLNNLTEQETSEYCLARWIRPRAERDKTYIGVSRSDIATLIANGHAHALEALLGPHQPPP